MSVINIQEKAEKIYANNKKFITDIVKKQVDNKMDKLNLLFDERCKIELKNIIIQDLTEKFKREIEYMMVIKELYPEDIKEEAIRKLPKYILQLR